MSYIGSTEWYQRVQRGEIPNTSIIHKFGHTIVSATMQPICYPGEYPTPTTAQELEFVSTSNDDGVGGSGAREIVVTGIDASWNEVTQTVVTNGTAAVILDTDLIRLTRWYVAPNGTYAAAGAGSHVGTLTIRVSGGGATWSQIPVAPLPMGQSLIGCYTIPTGKTANIIGGLLSMEATRTVDFLLMKRENADIVSAPFTGAMRTIMYEVGDINRFEKVGNFASYCRLVDSKRLSNKKRKGKGNSKNGNPYLSWAFTEASHFANRHRKPAQKFFQRKVRQTNTIVATRALAHKLGRASYYVMRDSVEFDPAKAFGAQQCEQE